MNCRNLVLSLALSLSAATGAQAQAIVGAWSFGDTLSPTSNGTGILVFLDNGVYFHAESDNVADAANGANGMERGTYTWNAATNAFTSSTVINTNGQWGLSHDSPSSIVVAGNSMDVDGFTLTRVTGSSPIVGAWSFGNTLSPASSGTGLLVFLDNGVYFHAESDNVADAANGLNGMERGTYTWDSVTGAFTSSTLVNTNGGWGLSDDSPAFITVSGNTLSIEDFTLTAVSAVPEPSTYAALAGLGALGLAAWRRRRFAV